MSNSKEQLLDYMRARESTQDWGAISMFGRARLNRLLEQQFVAGFDELSFLPAFNIERIDLNEDGLEWMTLEAIILSKPLLSFETASLDNSRATLSLGIMSGTVKTFRQVLGKPVMLASSFQVSEPQGYVLKMSINLHLVTGEVDARGRVTLDLRNSIEWSCNLSPLVFPQQQIGAAFGHWLKGLPRHKRVFELGNLDLKGYTPLTPTTFHIRTQAAPGAKNVKSSNYGEGGVLIFIALKGKPSPGYFPGEGSGFPYFIPDDRDSQGNDLYSAALVLSYDMIEHIEQQRLDLLNSLLFPGEHVFVESSRHVPKDLIVFGNIDPTLTSITLDPLVKVIHAGSALQYQVKQAGRAVRAANVQWSVRSINTHHAAGSISASGLYQSVPAQQLGKQVVRNVVTARYNDPGDGQERRASALVAVSYEAVTVAPQVSFSYLGAGTPPVHLSAVSLGGGDLAWTLLEPHLGSLSGAGSQATYTPPAELPGNPSLAIQTVQVQDLRTGFKAQVAVVLLARDPSLEVTPAHVSTLARSAEVQLHVSDEYPVENVRWSIVSGPGSVSASGLYKAPDQLDASTAVVRCEFVYGDAVLFSGYSLIQLSDFIAVQSWNRIKNFQLTAPAGQQRAIANGYQQIAVDIEIETEKVGDDYFPVTDEELSTLTIVHRDSGQALGFLPSNEEGIAEDSIDTWAVSTLENRFNAYDVLLPAVDEDRAGNLAAGIRRIRLFIHTRAREPNIFHARFLSEFVEYNSNENSNQAPYVIELVPSIPPAFDSSEYTFVAKRVAGGGNNPPVQEDYDFFLTTTDYWYLEFTSRQTGKTVRFLRCEFQGNQSTVQWESRRANETMFSYTGYVFNDEADQDDATVMQYDPRLQQLMPDQVLKTDLESGQVVGEGQLMISLFRVDNIRYANNETARALEQPLSLYLLDKNGNRHRLSLAFAPMVVADSRNTLLLNVI